MASPAAASPAVEAASQRPAAAARLVAQEDIQVRAYFLALENGGQEGSLDYWLRAERELLQTGRSGD